MRRRRLVASVGAALCLTLAITSGAVAKGPGHRHVNMLDDCDPATFNAVLGEGACVGGGGTTFEEFVGQLLSQGRAPAWRFAPATFKLASGGEIDAYNRGGEFHTFTEVAQFGGGCIDEVNALLGLTPVPECANAGVLFATTGAVPGGEVEVGPLSTGVHRFECLIHPWMRSTVTVG